MDFNIILSNKQILKGMIMSPGEKIRGVIVLIHGLGEHINRYSYWAELFCKEGIGFAGIDLPGHGQSDGRRGHIKSYSLLSEAIEILINSSRQTFPGVPLFLYGHSLGGGIVLDYLIKKNPDIRAAIVTSPWLKLSFEPPKVKMMIASLIDKILPGLVQDSGLNVNHISHDADVVRLYKNDPLVHGKISVRLAMEAGAAAQFSLLHAGELKVPTLLIHGSDDQITSPEGSTEFASRSKMVELKIFEGGYHELHNEPFKQDVFDFILKWINSKIE